MALIDSNITHHEFVSLINVKKYDGIKREFKNSNNKWKITIYKTMSSSCLKCRKKCWN